MSLSDVNTILGDPCSSTFVVKRPCLDCSQRRKMNDYSVEMDYNGLWFVMNGEGFPISRAYATELEAMSVQELLANN